MYKIEYNGITISNNPDRYADYILTSLTGLGVPPIRTSSRDNTGADGGRIWEQRYGMRVIGLRVETFSTSFEDYFLKRSALSDAFTINSSNLLTITRPDGQQFEINARVIFGADHLETAGEFANSISNIQLQCDNPFFRDPTGISSQPIGLSQGGGTPVPMPVASPIGRSDGGLVVVNNPGNFDASPTYTITGDVVNPSVQNSSNGTSFTVNRTLVLGDTLTIQDNQDGLQVLLNGNDVSGSFVGAFPVVHPGDNVYSFNAATFSPTARLVISFKSTTIAI